MEAEDIVISGISCRLPQSDNMEEFWENLINGVDMVTTDNQRYDTSFYGVPRYGQLKDITKFDASFFNVPPSLANRMDPALRMLLEVTYEAVVDSGTEASKMKGTKTGVFVGCGASEAHAAWTSNIDDVTGYEMIGCEHTMFANRISYYFDFKGPSYVASSACSSSLLTLHQAFKSMKRGECDAAVVAGAKLSLHPSVDKQFLKLGMLSPNGRCATFDAEADGYCRSEGIVVLFLQKKSEAKRTYCSLVNTRTNSNGHTDQGITFPSREAQTKLLREVYAEAGIDPAEVNYIEAHGTGTKAGDKQEAAALGEVFCQTRQQPLLVGSVKSNMGHTEHASGLVSIAKVILSMERGVLPGNLHFNTPNPDIPELQNGQLHVVAEKETWSGGYVGVNGFGFGGTNVHVILKSASGPRTKEEPGKGNHKSLILSAGRTDEACQNILDSVRYQCDNQQFQSLAKGFLTDSKHLFRGFAVSDGNEVANQQIEAFSAENRPVWYIFSGMGSQWCGMGRPLMKITPFRNSILLSDNVLKPKDFSLYDMLTDTDYTCGLQNVTKSFLGIVAVQIALVDTLKTIGIKADGMFGHSVGELACAYADGCMTREQTLLVAYERGRCIEEADLEEGAMAATGLSWEEAVSTCPANVVPACHNAQDSVTISGKKEDIADFVRVLKAKGVFAREVDSDGVAFHSFMMDGIKDRFRQRLDKIVTSPKRRSNGWISTSTLESDVDEEATQFCSAEYLVNNLTNPVFFHGAMRHVPENALVLEVAPHCLLQAILKRSLIQHQTVLGLVNKRAKNVEDSFLQSLGRCWINGKDIDATQLYGETEIKFPVMPGTPMISPLLQWDHSCTYDVPAADDFLGGGDKNSFTFKIDTTDVGKYAYLHDHVIDGRALFPATGFIFLAWSSLAKSKGQLLQETPVTFKDVKIHKATLLSTEKRLLEMTVSLHYGTESVMEFSITDDGGLIVSGNIHSAMDIESLNFKPPIEETTNFVVRRKDVYKELAVQGYQYKNHFQGIMCTDLTGGLAKVKWAGSWITFLDSLLQLQLLVSDTRALCLPSKLTSLMVDPVLFEEEVSTSGNDIMAHCDQHGIVKTKGIYIGQVEFGKTTRRPGHEKPAICAYTFQPYVSVGNRRSTSLGIQRQKNNVDGNTKTDCERLHEQSLREAIKLTAENCRRDIRVMLVNHNEQAKVLQSILDDLYHHDPVICTNRKDNVDHVKPGNGEFVELDFQKNGFQKTDLFDLLVINNEFVQTKRSLDDYLSHLNSVVAYGGFVLAHWYFATGDPCETDDDINKVDDLSDDLYSAFKRAKYKLVFQKESFKSECCMVWRKPQRNQTRTILPVTLKDFSWIKRLQMEMKKPLHSPEDHTVWLVSDEMTNGLLGFIKCLHQEPGGHRVRCLVNLSEDKSVCVEKLVETSSARDLVINVYYKNQWGSFCDNVISRHNYDDFSFVDIETPSDLSSLHWKSSHSRLVLEEENRVTVKTHYAALNFRDVMLATGKLPMDIIEGGMSKSEGKLGMEFSGVDSSGRRVTGLTQAMGLATIVSVDPNWIWRVPNHWSLEEAATVPAAYCTAYYALVMRGSIQECESILIHSGTGSLGQAAISLALSYNCDVFVTVGNEEKKKYLLSMFPALCKDHIYSSRNTQFEAKVMEATQGQGVDIVLNSLSGDKLEAGLRVLAQDGRFLEVGKADIINNKLIGMAQLLKNTAILGVHLDMLQAHGGKHVKRLWNLVQKGLDSGVVKPLKTTVFERDHVEAAFRYMTKGIHIGKILLKIRQDDSTLLPVSEVNHRTTFEERKSYIITGGLGGLGLELTEWMVSRGARRFIFTSRFGETSGFQRRKLRYLRDKGVSIQILKKDLTSQEDAKRLIADTKNSVGGIFHLAGCIKDQPFETMSVQDFRDVCQPKVDVATNLDIATRKYCGSELDWFVVFSSAVSSRGNAGQTNYGYANSCMELLCEKRHRDGLPGLAIEFGAIGDVGMAAEVLSKDAIIGGTRRQTLVSFLASLDTALNQKDPIVSVCVNARKEKMGSSHGMSFSDTIFKVMGLNGEKIPKDATLQDVGLDSLMALEVKNLVERRMKNVVTTQDVQRLTVRQILDLNN